MANANERWRITLALLAIAIPLLSATAILWMMRDSALDPSIGITALSVGLALPILLIAWKAQRPPTRKQFIRMLAYSFTIFGMAGLFLTLVFNHMAFWQAILLTIATGIGAGRLWAWLMRDLSSLFRR